MKIERQVQISDKITTFFKAHISGNEENDRVRLSLKSSIINIMDIEGQDFLDCFLKLRELLEEKQIYMLCQGSAKNVHASGMVREMSSGLKAYALEMGRKSSREQLVDIFDPASFEIVGTIKDQSDFFENWIKSKKD